MALGRVMISFHTVPFICEVVFLSSFVATRLPGNQQRKFISKHQTIASLHRILACDIEYQPVVCWLDENYEAISITSKKSENSFVSYEELNKCLNIKTTIVLSIGRVLLSCMKLFLLHVTLNRVDKFCNLQQ